MSRQSWLTIICIIALGFNLIQIVYGVENFTFTNSDGTIGVYNKTKMCNEPQTYNACIAAFEAVEETARIINNLNN